MSAFVQDIVEAVRHPLLVLNRGLVVVAANVAFAQAFSMPQEKICGRPLFGLGGPWNHPVLRALLEERMQQEDRVEGVEWQFTCPVRGPCTFLLSARRVPQCGTDAPLLWLALEEVQRQSEEQYRQLLEILPHMVWMTRPDGSACFLNQRGASHLGLPAEATFGWGWLGLVHPEDKERTRLTWEKAVQAGEPYRYEYRMRQADGAYRWHLAQGVPLRRPDGMVEKWVGTLTDIDDWRHAEEELRLFRTLIDHTTDAIEVIDPATGKFLDVNEKACLAHGYTREEYLALSVEDVDPLVAAETWAKAAAAHKETGSQLSETLHRCKDGTTFPVEVNLNFVHLDRDYLVAVVRDLTERKRAEQELREREALLRTIITHIPCAVFWKDRNSVYLGCNEQLAHNHGFAGPEEVVGKTDYDLGVTPAEAEFYRACDRQVMETGRPLLNIEETQTRADGTLCILLTSRVPLRDPSGAVVGILGVYLDITERKKALEDLRLRDRAIQAVTQGILITDPHQSDNPIIYASPGFTRLTGYDVAEVLGRNCRFLQGHGTDPGTIARISEALHTEVPCTVEMLNYRKDGTPFWNELSISPVHDEQGRLTHFVGVQADVTQRRKLEEQYRHAQKMEAIGQLAGGIAHDFNNLLTVINGYCDLLLEELPVADPCRNLVQEIRKAGERSAALTSQLLVFSRKQVTAPQVFDLNEVVRNAEKLLRRLIGEDVQMKIDLQPALGYVVADPGQWEQVLLNLAVNARDAMPEGGTLTISTTVVQLDEAYARHHPQMKPGCYVQLTVADTGCGMPPEVLARIFEPYFTTKGPGKGTGLGLAVVHGIVQQSQGHLEACSAPGQGTCFKIFLPRLESLPLQARPLSGRRLALPHGTETILLAEDEDGVRDLARRVLVGCGYQVLAARNGEEALRLATTHAGAVHLLVTDVVMPGMGGRKLAEQFLQHYPTAKVLYMSGYADDAMIRHGVQYERVQFLQKPFTPISLARKAHEVLHV
jgi:PAS domain S-box-containing protein